MAFENRAGASEQLVPNCRLSDKSTGGLQILLVRSVE